MIKYERLSEKTFGTLSGYHYEIKMYDDMGQTVVDPEEATKFFIFEPRMLVTIDREEGRLTLTVSSDEEFSTTKKLQSRLKALANEFLINYTIRNYGKKIVPRDFAMDAKIKQHKELQKSEEQDGRTFQQKAAEELGESVGKMFGYRKTSYQKVNEVKIKVKHVRSVNEEKKGARSRNIAHIMIEWGDSTYDMPTNNLPAARALASHISRGGEVTDCIGEYVVNSSKRLKEMKKFIKYASSNSLINDDTADIIESLKEHISTIRNDFQDLTKPTRYGEVCDRIVSSSNQESDSGDCCIDDVKDKFTVKYFDSSLEDILPEISRIAAQNSTRFRKIEDQSKLPHYIDDLNESSLQFDNPKMKVGYMIGVISRGCKYPELSEFLGGVSRKISDGDELSEFETNVVMNVFNNISRRH